MFNPAVAQLPNVLQKIVSDKKLAVQRRKQLRPLIEFQSSIIKSKRSLFDALNNSRCDFILECKKASPSKGLIRADFDIKEIVKSYQPFASAISVLTDEPYFQGKLDYLTIASQTTDKPILCKDFIIDSYQVYEARAYGADAILLMLSVLDDESYAELAQVANYLSLDVLTEVHDQSELERAIQLDAKIIGINNRDLRDLSIDLNNTVNLAAKIPEDRIVISESGIETRRDILALNKMVDGFLIGSSIMKETNIADKLKSLVYGSVKVCGISSVKDAKCAAENGATFAGLMFYEKSPREITLENAKRVIREVQNIKYVGVFVNEKIEKVLSIAKALNLFAIQLHGDETSEYIKELSAKMQETQVWKAIRVSQKFEFDETLPIDRIVLDSFNLNEYGGTGERFDWTLIPDNIRSKVILAGGINQSNAIEAQKLDVYAIDLSSGLESIKGIKEHKKIDDLFTILRA